MTAHSPMAPSASTPSRFGRYTILGELGRGGIASVHLARHDAGGVCVLKRLLGEHADNAGLERRFRREANLSARLHHRHIARVLDSGVEEGIAFIAFELILGQTLTSVFARLVDHRSWVTPSTALRVAIDVLDGLSHAHALADTDGRPLGLVHRDLSPNNVMIAYAGDVKIIDFGLAAAKLDDFRTAVGQYIGTLRYMSPEQALAAPVDARSDLYTVGVWLFEMISQTRLLQKAPMKATLAAIVGERAPRVTGVPDALADAIARALEKNPAERFQSAAEMRRALLAVRGVPIAEPRDLARLLQHHFPAEREAALRLADAAGLGGAQTELAPLEEGMGEATELATGFRPSSAAGVGAEPDDGPRTELVGPDDDRPDDDRPDDDRTAVPVRRRMGVTATEIDVVDAVVAGVGARLTGTLLLPGTARAEVVRPPAGLGRSKLLWGLAAIPALAGLGLAAAAFFSTPGPSAARSTVPAAQEPPAVVARPAARSAGEAEGANEAAPGERREVPSGGEPAAKSALREPGTREPARVAARDGRAPRRERPTTRVAPEVAEPAQPRPKAPAHRELEELLGELRARPTDGAVLVRLHRGIKRASGLLAPEVRRAIDLEIDAGLRGGDVEAMARGLARLEAAAP